MGFFGLTCLGPPRIRKVTRERSSHAVSVFRAAFQRSEQLLVAGGARGVCPGSVWPYVPSRARVEEMRLHLVIRRAVVLSLALLILSAAVGSAAAAGLEVFVIDPAFSPFNVAGRTAIIRGVGFRSSTTVTFDSTAAATTFVNSRTLSVTIPTFASARTTTINVTDSVNGADEFYPFLHTGPVFYVATTGLDTNNGTSPSTPFRTIFKGTDITSGTTPTEVRVAAGTYLESQLAVYEGNVISCGWQPGFALRDPDAQITVIDAARNGFALRSAGLLNVSIIDGCTILNGFRDGLGGGGVVVSSDNMIVSNNVIAGNTSATMGGGVYFTATAAYGGKPTVSNNVLIGNRSHNKSGGAIGIYPNYNSQLEVRVTIAGNEIVGNRSYFGRGGGFALATSSYAGYNNGSLKMADNVFSHNRARTGGGMAITFFTFGDLYDLSTENNLFVGNAAFGAGGGVAFEGTGMLSGSFSRNTLALNSGAPTLGGGFLIDGSMTLLPGFTASDMILWGNVGGDAAGQAFGTITWSDAGMQLPGTGNFSNDPAFTPGPLSGFYLTQADPNAPDSPAVDAGSDLATEHSLDALTTRADGLGDAGVADLGFHHRAGAGPSANPIQVRRVDPPTGDLLGNDWVLVRGEGFDPGAAVEFAGAPAADLRFLNNRRIVAKPPAHALGAVNVTVRNPDTTFATATGAYTYVDNEPPAWATTVGLVTAVGGLDCVRSAVLTWNPAVEATTPPVVYEIHREECIATTNTTVPCANFSYIPSSANSIATTRDGWFTDTGFASGGAAKKWVYTVRARDSFNPFNKEWNMAKRVTLVGTTAGETTPPPAIGANLAWVPGSTTQLDWPSRIGATAYGLYRQTAASAYANTGITPFIVLTSANNNFDGDSVVDSAYAATAVPAFGQIHFYKVTARDPCGNETRSELLP